jgi:plastocyanin
MASRIPTWMLAALLVVPGCATTGAIRGTLRLPSPPALASIADSARSGVPSPAAERATDAVIYLEEVPPRVAKRPEPGIAAANIAQIDHSFVPRVLPVAVGTTVRFENRDRVYHNVFSVSPAKRFDIGKYAPSQMRQVTFDTPGVVELFCDIDPSMAGFVFVVPHQIFTRPDASGAFALPKLPRGNYILKAWHPSLGRLSRKVEMPKKGDLVVTLHF